MNIEDKAKQLQKEYNQQWRKKNKKKVAEYNRQYRLKNKKKFAEYRKNYWLRKAAKLDNLTSQVIELHSAGLSLRKIAEQTGLNHMKVKRILDTVT